MKSNVSQKRFQNRGGLLWDSDTDWLSDMLKLSVPNLHRLLSFISFKSRLARQEIFSLSFAHPCIDLSVETIMKVKIE